ncbi:MAG: hypothetical protein QOG23_4637 [Blastocatellia bacterium]|nr:hypothetical protein [Blastocatellia bacterium]
MQSEKGAIMTSRSGYLKLRREAIFLSNLTKNNARNGVNSVALVHPQKVIGCKSLKWLVPRAGVEPARPYGQRILSLKSRVPARMPKF